MPVLKTKANGKAIDDGRKARARTIEQRKFLACVCVGGGCLLVCVCVGQTRSH